MSLTSLSRQRALTGSAGRISTAVSVLTGVSIAINLFREGKSHWDDWTLYSATINSKSFVYPILMEWLNQETHSKKIKFVSEYAGVKKFYDGSGRTNVSIKGHTLSAKLNQPETNERLDERVDKLFSNDLIFTSRDKSGIEALYEFLQELTEKRKRQERDIYLFNQTSYGWDGKNLPFRNLDSIFLNPGVKEDLIEDLNSFINSEDRYLNIGIPWHRGYLFYGAPGNGKSSLAAAIAHRYRLNLYNLPLSGVKDDKALAESISKIQDNSILLLEDIDIFSKSMAREQPESGPTLAGLLNTLDGVSTPHGLITFMTTNYIGNLDPALIRPGRIDKRLELFAPSQYQIENMFLYVYNEPLNVKSREFENMAALSNVFKKYPDDAEAARLEIKHE